MESINVYVIYDKIEYDYDKVVKELTEEGYAYNFAFFDRLDNDVSKEYHLKHTHECWLFGNCSEIEDCKLAIELGCDIWQMG